MLEKYWFWILLVLVVLFFGPQIKKWFVAQYTAVKAWFAARAAARAAAPTPPVRNWKPVIVVVLVILLLCHGYQKNWYGLFSKKQTVAVVTPPLAQPVVVPPVVNPPVVEPVNPTPPPKVETKVVYIKPVPVITKVVETKVIETKIVVVEGKPGKDGQKGDIGPQGPKGEPATPPKDETKPAPPKETPPPAEETEVTFDFENKDLAIAKKELDRWGWFIEPNDTGYFSNCDGNNFDKTELRAGDTVVINCYTSKGIDFTGQNGKNVLYFQAKVDNPRIRFTAIDGQWFIMRREKKISLETCKQAMIKTILWYHNTDPNDPVYSALKPQIIELTPQ